MLLILCGIVIFRQYSVADGFEYYIDEDWHNLAKYDSDNFVCDKFDEFCQIDCPIAGRTCLGCGSTDGSIPNTLPNYVGTCKCDTNDIFIDVSGSTIGKEFYDNRIKSDVFWLLSPWTGPPYNLNSSYENACSLALERLGCPVENVSMNGYGRAVVTHEGIVPPYTCTCGNFHAASARTAQSIVDKINEALLMVTKVYSRPITLSLQASMAIVFIAGKVGGTLASYVNLPPVIGYLMAGICIQDYVYTGLIHGCGGTGPHPIPFSEMKSLALLVVLMRAGLTLDIQEVSLTTLVLAVFPYLAEFGIIFYASFNILHWGVYECGMLASILAALSPSIVIPEMIRLVEEGLGHVPAQVLIAAPFEVVLADIMFNIFVSLIQAGGSELYPWVEPLPLWAGVLLIPVNIAFSLFLGCVMGYVVSQYLIWRTNPKVESNKTVQRVFENTVGDQLFPLLVGCYLLNAVCVPHYIPQSSGILSVFSCCLTCAQLLPTHIADVLREGLYGLWIFLEIMLFTATGISLAFDSTNGPLQSQRGMSLSKMADFVKIFFLGCAGRGLCLLGCHWFVIPAFDSPHRWHWKHRLGGWLATWSFQWPKATVQAVLGGVPLQLTLLTGTTGVARATDIMRASAFCVLLMAPLGVILSRYVGKLIVRFLLSLDASDTAGTMDSHAPSKAKVAEEEEEEEEEGEVNTTHDVWLEEEMKGTAITKGNTLSSLCVDCSPIDIHAAIVLEDKQCICIPPMSQDSPYVDTRS